MEETGHWEVKEQVTLRYFLLELTNTWYVIPTCENSVPFGTWAHLFELVCREIQSLSLKRLGRINNETERFVANAFIIMEFSLMAKIFKSVHVHVKIEISAYHRNVLESA
jgi:hypothetical protein